MEKILSNPEKILRNPGLSHIREQIFGHLDPDTLENCYEVCVERFGEDWDFAWWTTFQAKRSALIQYIFEVQSPLSLFLSAF